MITALRGVFITGANQVAQNDQLVEYRCPATGRTGRISLSPDGQLVAEVLETNRNLLWNAVGSSDEDPSHRRWDSTTVSFRHPDDCGDAEMLSDFVDWLTNTKFKSHPIIHC